jgi:hypothetical protein
MNLSVSPKQYDLVFQKARAAGLTVPEYLRSRLPRPDRT